MAVTTPQLEYQRLRKYLNPAIRGPNTQAILQSLTTSSGYLVNTMRAISDQLYIATASESYLDERLAQFEITRPELVGLSDDIFREIGIQVKNRKQVRDLINNLLDLLFGDEYTKATNSSNYFAPYNLQNGDNLIINFDSHYTVNVVFTTGQFASIAAATAQEVADAITSAVSTAGYPGLAIAKNNGNGNFVEIISGTIGPASSVTIMGGSAQNVLRFDSILPAGGNASTVWTISISPKGLQRFTWTGGGDPQIGKVSARDYVNIYGGGFASSTNVGSFPIVDRQGGIVGSAYFDIVNPVGTTGMVTQGSNNAVLFYTPVRHVLATNPAYAAVYQTESQTLQIFLPATTQIVRRSRMGAAYLHYPPYGTFTFGTFAAPANPSNGDHFSITSTITYIAGTDFVIGATSQITIQNLANLINANIPGLVANVHAGSLLVQSDSLSITLTMAYTGLQNIIGSGPQGDPTSLEPNQYGPYIYDLSQGFTIGAAHTTLVNELDASTSRVVVVEDSTSFPNSAGYVILGYGTEEQEGPVPYTATPSGNTILLSPTYVLQNRHPAGSTVTTVDYKAPIVITQTGSDYPAYVTTSVAGTVYAEELIQQVAAIGINIVFVIKYPNDQGLAKWGTQYSEITYVYGSDTAIA